MKKMLRMAAAALCLTIAAGSSTAHANKAAEPAKFQYSPSLGYILIRVGPVKKDVTKAAPLILVRLNSDGEAKWQLGNGMVDSKNNLDVSFIWSSKHWGFDGDSNLYVVPVNPGRWVIGAANNTTFSLGSYAFDVKPGQLAYVGKVLIGQENGKSDVPEIKNSILSQDLMDFGTLMNIVMSDTFVLRKPTGSESFPEKLSAIGIVNAEIQDDVRFDNFTKSLVGRAADLPASFTLAPAAQPAQAPAPSPALPNSTD